MMTDGIVDLYRAGRITGAKKQLNTGKMVCTFSLGAQYLYDFLHKNPMVEFHPVDYTNMPHIIMQNHNVAAINNTTQMDLQGQAASESDGYRHISGTGGQSQFVRGAYASKGGKSFICLASTFDKKGERKSRIVTALTKGNIVTTPHTPGELFIRSPGVFTEYYKAREQFLKDRRGDKQTVGDVAYFDEEGFYCLGDAARFEDPEHPEKGLIFDGRVTEDFKLDSGTWVSVGTLRPDIVAACAPLVYDGVICGQDKKFIGALLWPSPAAMKAATGFSRPPDGARGRGILLYSPSHEPSDLRHSSHLAPRGLPLAAHVPAQRRPRARHGQGLREGRHL
jgi:hypothetical protein